MSKRKRAPKSPDDQPTDDASTKDDMVHVTSDLLAGGPEIFAAKKSEAEPEPEPEATVPEAMTPEPPAEPEPEPEPEPVEPFRPVAEEAPAPPSATTETPPPATPPPAPFVKAEPSTARPRRGGSAAALGIVLVVLGLFALAVELSGSNLTENGWPLFILIPGLTLLVVGFVSFGSAATIPGGVVTMLGVVLAYANATGDWPIWAYGWSLVVPFGIGLGMYLQALRDRDQQALRTGRTLLFVGAMIFIIGFVLFESILGISGRDYFGPLGKAALPGLLIIVGVILLVRSVQRSRREA